MVNSVGVPRFNIMGTFTFQYPVLGAFTLALLPIMKTDLGISRTEGGILLSAYGLYVAALYLVPGFQ